MSALCTSGDFPQRRMSLMEEEMEDIDVLKPIQTQCNNEKQHSPLVILTPALTALNEDTAFRTRTQAPTTTRKFLKMPA